MAPLRLDYTRATAAHIFIFPTPPAQYGATWNRSLFFELGAIIATETRALWLAGAVEESEWSGRGHIGLDTWSPNM